MGASNTGGIPGAVPICHDCALQGWNLQEVSGQKGVKEKCGNLVIADNFK